MATKSRVGVLPILLLAGAAAMFGPQLFNEVKKQLGDLTTDTAALRDALLCVDRLAGWEELACSSGRSWLDLRPSQIAIPPQRTWVPVQPSVAEIAARLAATSTPHRGLTMKTTATVGIQLDSLRELSNAKAQYEESHGWQVSVDVGQQRLVMPILSGVDAVIMPSALAEDVITQLRVAMLTGPVAAAPDGQWLTFLTAPNRASRPGCPAELRRARVQLVPRGGQVIVPASFDTRPDSGGWRWVEPPQSRRALPPWSAVIVAARRAVSGNHTTGVLS